MSFDARFVGSWFGDETFITVVEDATSGDGRWYLSSGMTPYSFPDADSLICGHYDDGAPFRWRRIGSPSANPIIGHWRHEAEAERAGDEGEDMILSADGNSLVRFDSEAIEYHGIFELSQDQNGFTIALFDDHARLQTSADTFTLNVTGSGSHGGSFVFGVDPQTNRDIVSMTYASSPEISFRMQRI